MTRKPDDAAKIMQLAAMFSESARVIDLSAARARSGLSVDAYCAEMDALAGVAPGMAAACYRMGRFFL